MIRLFKFLSYFLVSNGNYKSLILPVINEVAREFQGFQSIRFI